MNESVKQQPEKRGGEAEREREVSVSRVQRLLLSSQTMADEMTKRRSGQVKETVCVRVSLAYA